MSASFPNGTVLAVSTAFASPKTISALTNANPAVATSTSHGLTDGTVGVLTSGWVDLHDRVFRTADSDTNTFKLEGADTTDTQRFPSGEGIGSFKPVSTWVTLSQVRDMSKSGGEQQFFTWQYLEDKSSRQRQRPTFKTAKSITVVLDYDPALAWYDALANADAAKDSVVLRATLPNGALIYYHVYPSFDADPSLTLNENMTNTATFSLMGDLTRYNS